MSRTFADGVRWADEGTALVRRAIDAWGTDERAWDAPSALPGWSRKYLLSHLNGNARALRNLATWARTGVETPMYASPEQRLADIVAGAALSAPRLLDAFAAVTDALASDWAALTPQQWTAPVKTVVGRTVAASETPWMRAREVMVHAVDLDADVTFADLPGDFCAALCDDIVEKRSAGGGAAMRVTASDHDLTWQWGEGAASEVVGPLAQVTAWLAGRAHRDVTTAGGAPAPDLPAWL